MVDLGNQNARPVLAIGLGFKFILLTWSKISDEKSTTKISSLADDPIQVPVRNKCKTILEGTHICFLKIYTLFKKLPQRGAHKET